MRAIDFEILRDVQASGRIWLPLARQPVRVATLIDEADFLKEQTLRHNQNVFLEDRLHDWDWRDGRFSYYTRVAERADVLVVYALEPAPKLGRLKP